VPFELEQTAAFLPLSLTGTGRPPTRATAKGGGPHRARAPRTVGGEPLPPPAGTAHAHMMP